MALFLTLGGSTCGHVVALGDVFTLRSKTFAACVAAKCRFEQKCLSAQWKRGIDRPIAAHVCVFKIWELYLSCARAGCAVKWQIFNFASIEKGINFFQWQSEPERPEGRRRRAVCFMLFLPAATSHFPSDVYSGQTRYGCADGRRPFLFFLERMFFSLWNNQIAEEDSLSFVKLLAGDAASSRRRRRVWQVFSPDSKRFSGSFTRPPRDKKPHGWMTMQPPPNRRIRLSRLPEAPALHSPSCLFSVCANTSDAGNGLERRERLSTLESKDTSINL